MKCNATRAREGPLRLTDKRRSLKRKENGRKSLHLGIQTDDKLAKPQFFVAYSRLGHHCRNLAEEGGRGADERSIKIFNCSQNLNECSLARAPQIFALLASSQSKFLISARARKKIAVLGMLANARKDHSSPLGRRRRQVKCNNWTQV